MKVKTFLFRAWGWLKGVFIMWSALLLTIILVSLFPAVIGYCADLLEGTEGAEYWFISILPTAIFVTGIIWCAKLFSKAKGYFENL